MRYLLILSLLCSPFLFAQENDDDAEELLSSVSHTLSLGGEKIAYESVAGRLPIYNYKGQESARIFFIAYSEESTDNKVRPVTFIFPGGPGGACGPESICSFGPRRLPLTAEGKPSRPPYTLIDNPQTLLRETDLVFVDPVGTGYSMLTERDDASFYTSALGDVLSLGNFISNYLTTFRRWNAPVFLSGISYGTSRACGVAAVLNYQFGIPVRGLILMGNAIEISLISSHRDRYLPDCLLIPTYAATAWYHGRLWPDRSLGEVVEHARRFAYEDYAPAMAQPTRLDLAEKNQFFNSLAQMTGLDVATIRRYNGRIDEEIFTTEFFASERKILGGLDTRYKGEQTSIKREGLDEDPSYAQETRGLAPSFLHYLQTELQAPQFPNIPYTFYAQQPWSFDIDDWLYWLRRVLIENPEMQIFCANGYYDCRTPFTATEYSFDQLDLPFSYRQNVEFKYYEAGHGLIFDAKVLKQLHQDIVGFYKK